MEGKGFVGAETGAVVESGNDLGAESALPASDDGWTGAMEGKGFAGAETGAVVESDNDLGAESAGVGCAAGNTDPSGVPAAWEGDPASAELAPEVRAARLLASGTARSGAEEATELPERAPSNEAPI
jgi:hypothetical protein